ncbi:unnamed protein product [Adineta steineri]|uniref:G-protein coupled receptors family 1 profile domain-containing protein n=1 Tax=Adineta steineri TaxID=433720 RepID=A0A819J115_9BILA|nr:unnamed protein product [Adineta steineri]
MVELDVISHQLMIIVGIIMYILGFFGNILNICVFTKWSFSRKTPNENNANNRTGNSSLYLLATSIANFILILYPLFVRIYVDGYQNLVTPTSAVLLCKIRYYVLQTSLVISLACICLATFDRYLITARSVRLRQLSTTRRSTQIIILSITIFSALHSIPMALYYDKSSTGDCSIVSLTYSNYYLYFVIVCLYGIFPVCFLSIFGTLTYRQLKMLKHTNQNGSLNIDKQLSRMLLFQCIALVFSYIPYCAQNIYFSKFVDKKVAPTGFNLLFRILTIILFYVNPVMSFYIYYISTPNFRRQVKKIILYLCHNRQRIHNRVHDLTTTIGVH